MSFRKVLDKLNNLPDEEQYLTQGLYVDSDGKCGCVLGKLLTKEQKTLIIEKQYNSTGDFGMPTEIRERWSKEYGMTEGEYHQLQRKNDTFVGETGVGQDPREEPMEGKRARFKAVMEWLRERVYDEENRRPE